MPIALTREPASTIVHCELTYIERETIDFERALQQHRRYREMLTQCGAQVITLPAHEALPDSVFVEDPAIVLDEVAILASPGPASRRAEVDLIEPELARFRPTMRISPPAIIEGGDVLRIGKTLYVGLSSRTNHAGVAALRQIAEPYGYAVAPVAVWGCLHLKTGCTALDEHTLLVNPDWIDPTLLAGYRLVSVAPEEPWAANVLRVNSALMMNAACPETIRRVESLGFRVTPIDLTEFMKAEAGPTCMSLLV